MSSNHGHPDVQQGKEKERKEKEKGKKKKKKKIKAKKFIKILTMKGTKAIQKYVCQPGRF